MKGKRLIGLIMALVVGISLIIGACAPAAPAPEVPEVPEVPKEKALRLTIGGGTIGGSTNLGANALAGICKKWLGIEATVITVPGMGSAGVLVDEGVQIITVGSSDVYDAYMGIGPYEGQEPLNQIRKLIPTSSSPLLIHVPADSDINTFRDLVGKRICPNVKGTTGEAQLAMLCGALGIAYPDDFDVVYLGHKEAAAAMIAGKIVAHITSVDPPHPTFMEVDLTYPIKVIGLSEDDLATFLKKYPYYSTVFIPAEFYHMEDPATIFGFSSAMHALPDLSEDIVYGLMKHWVENSDYLGYYHVSLESFVASGGAKNAIESTLAGIPLHAGALRYYKEAGWSIPPGVIPPEAK